MNQAVAKTAVTGCLAPIDKQGLDGLIAKGKADPKVIKTLKCKTVAEGRFRHLNFVRNLPAYVVDEPPGLLGDDTAPNPSEASLVARGITVFKLEIELEGDLNITGVWGTGDLSEKPVGFTDVRAKVTFEADRPRAELDALIAHARVWSPVANTFTRPVNLDVTLA